MRKGAIAEALLASSLVLAATGCGGGKPVFPVPGGAGQLSGVAVKGRISGGTVTAYPLSKEGEPGAALGSATTDESGAFTVEVPSYNGAVLLVVSSGTYAEEAVAGARVRLDGQELTAIVPEYRATTIVSDIVVTPASHWTAGLAAFISRAERTSIKAAYLEAAQHIHQHLGDVRWDAVVPADVTSDSGHQLDEAGVAGLILGALSMQARSIAENAGLTAGGSLNSMALVDSLYDDVTFDGYFDGMGDDGILYLPKGGGAKAFKLDGQTLRLSLALALQRFQGSDRNGWAIASADTAQLRENLSRNSNPRIFRDSGSD
ncbi:MAG TPA: hypothetical protein VE549_04865, partial [Myxococcaceae bacterium]|nr:hypothetical protein [Myxococcaceae bacterium]